MNFKGISIRMEDGANKIYHHFDEVEADYIAGKIPVKSIKSTLTKALNEVLEPVRKHFATNAEAKELLETVKKYQADIAKQKANEVEKL